MLVTSLVSGSKADCSVKKLPRGTIGASSTHELIANLPQRASPFRDSHVGLGRTRGGAGYLIVEADASFELLDLGFGDLPGSICFLTAKFAVGTDTS